MMESAFGLYTHIRANRWRSVLLLVGMFPLLYLIAFALTLLFFAQTSIDDTDQIIASSLDALPTVLPVATIVGIVWIAFGWRYNQALIDRVVRGEDSGRGDHPRLHDLLENLCISRGTPTPRLRVLDDAALNAFATGVNPRQYSITLTTGLIGALDDREIEAVLGHELTHIRNGDVRLMIIAGIIANIVAFFAEAIFRSTVNIRPAPSRERSKGGGGPLILLAFALIALAWIMSLVIKLALSRTREYLADAGAVELTKNPDALISALRKIEGHGEIARANSAIMEMCIDNPREGFADLFATHPSIDARVDRLVRFAGGHDVAQAHPGPWSPTDKPVA